MQKITKYIKVNKEYKIYIYNVKYKNKIVSKLPSIITYY